MFEELKQLLIEEMQIKEADITPDARLIDDLGFNSLELADLVIMCEDKFNIEFDEEEAKNFVSVSDVASYIQSLVK